MALTASVCGENSDASKKLYRTVQKLSVEAQFKTQALLYIIREDANKTEMHGPHSRLLRFLYQNWLHCIESWNFALQVNNKDSYFSEMNVP